MLDFRDILTRLLSHILVPFQLAFDWNHKPVTAPDDPLDFGTSTLFVRDPDGNLVEFVRLGSGIFVESTLPHANSEGEPRAHRAASVSHEARRLPSGDTTRTNTLGEFFSIRSSGPYSARARMTS